MKNYQFWTLVGMLIIGFGWLMHRLSEIDNDFAILEKILSTLVR